MQCLSVSIILPRPATRLVTVDLIGVKFLNWLQQVPVLRHPLQRRLQPELQQLPRL